MYENFTLLLMMQHYPVSQKFHIISCQDICIDTNVANFLQAAEQKINQRVFDRINAYASAAVQR